MRRLLFLFIVPLFVQCDPSRIYERNLDFENLVWHEDSITSFDFEIKDIKTPVNIKLNLRNSHDYPYENIYIAYWLKQDTITLKTNTDEIRNMNQYYLYDSKTGEPLGKGLGDVFEHQFTLLENYRFEKTGSFSLQLSQFMRDTELDGVLSVGVRVEKYQQPD